MDKQYWEDYYNNKNNINQTPSLFAQYVRNKLNADSNIVEIGCGTGRDTIYFADNKINVLAVDQCDYLNNYINAKKNDRIKFLCADFTKLNNLGRFDGIYSRFSLHAITEKEEDNLLSWVRDNLKIGGKIYIEARSTQNELFKKGKKVKNIKNCYIFNNHKRRFIDSREFCAKLKSNNLNIIECVESRNFAPNKDENQVFMRIIAEKCKA